MKFAGLRAASPVWGTEKCVLTGGEPSLRRDFTDIIAAVRENDAIRQIGVTTNGYRLERDVANWRDAGLTGINVSVDSPTPAAFTALPGRINSTVSWRGLMLHLRPVLRRSKSIPCWMRDVNHHQLDTF